MFLPIFMSEKCFFGFVFILLYYCAAEASTARRLPLHSGRVPQRSGNGLPERVLSVPAGQHQCVCTT